MQRKKKEVETQIIEAGKKLFLKDGFEQTSLRKIVKEAGTTLGNFSNYFENKEALFEVIVKPAHDGFGEFLKHHDEEDQENTSFDQVDVKQIMREIITNMPFVFTDSFVLLVEGASGTKYATYGDEIRAFMRKHFMEHLRGHVEDSYGDIAANMFLTGLVQIIKENKNKETVEKLVCRHILFLAMGAYAMIEMEGKDDSGN